MVEQGEEKLWEEGEITPYMNVDSLSLLLNPEEQVKVSYTIRQDLKAPIKENDIIGTAEYYLNNEKIKVYNIYSGNEIAPIDLKLCIQQIIKKILL